MSTRSHLVVRYQDGTNHEAMGFYRHHDGYPAWAGRMLARLAKRWDGRSLEWSTAPFWGFACDVIRHEEGGQGPYRYPYQPSDTIAGDIQFLYVVEIRKTVMGKAAVRAGWLEVPIGDDLPAISSVPLFDLVDYRYQVAREAAGYRKRLNAYRERQKAAATA